MKKIVISIASLIVLSAQGVLAHGLDIELKFHYPAVVSRTLYDANQPGKNINISIFTPADSKTPFQSGMTDQAGYFAFIPDTEGIWIIKVDDGHGHREQMKVTVSSEFLNPEKPVDLAEATPPTTETIVETSQPQIPTLYKVIVGLSLIFGISGIFYGYKANQSKKQ